MASILDLNIYEFAHKAMSQLDSDVNLADLRVLKSIGQQVEKNLLQPQTVGSNFVSLAF